VNDEQKMTEEMPAEQVPQTATGSLAAAKALLEAACALWPTNDGRHPGLLLNEDHLCIAIPWEDGYRVVAIHESDYNVDPRLIVGAIDRFFTTFDAQAPAAATSNVEQ
jgi:hypothetical protein